MQYLIRQFKDSTGHIHTDIEKARTNETLSIVEAEDKEEAKKKRMKVTGLSECPNCKQLGRNLVAKDYDAPIEYMKCKLCGHYYHRIGGEYNV